MSGDVGALRAAIGSVFEAAYVRPADHPITQIEGYHESAEPIEGGAYWIEPNLRESMIVLAEDEGAGRAILRQVLLHFDGSHKYAGIQESRSSQLWSGSRNKGLMTLRIDAPRV